MTQPYSFTTPLTPSTRMRLPRSGFVQTGLEEINGQSPRSRLLAQNNIRVCSSLERNPNNCEWKTFPKLILVT